MTDADDYCVLVPVAVLDGQSVPTTIVEAFAPIPVLLLGYNEVPDQTLPAQARDQYGERAKRELEERRSVFEGAGCPVTSRLVFTNDRFTTFERVAVEAECNAILILNPVPVLETMLVAIRSNVNLDRLAHLVATVLEGTEIEVTLFHAVSKKSKRGQGEELLETAASAFVDAGVDSERVSRSVVIADSPTSAILEAAEDHDFIVAGESRPSIRQYIFRGRAERIAKRTSDPVLVVRGEYLEGENEADGNTDSGKSLGS
jgi:nucleotide-binding universal stress UspA family protein